MKHKRAIFHALAERQSKIQDQKLEAKIVDAYMVEIVVAHMEKVAGVRKGAQWLAALSGSMGTRKVNPNSV